MASNAHGPLQALACLLSRVLARVTLAAVVLAAVVPAAVVLAPSALRAEGLVCLLSTNAVEIASNYTGADIAIFGAIERDGKTVARGAPYEMIITIKGPPSPVVVREKEKAGIIWVNAEQRKFGDVPGFYALLSSNPLNDVVDDYTLRKMQLGNFALTSSIERPADEDLVRPNRTVGAVFSDALIRLRKSQGLFLENPQAVEFLRANTFRAQIALPANAPLGRYEVTAYLFSGTVMLAKENVGFFVRKIGFEAATAAAARNRPLLYGLAAVVIALLAGWLASVVFRRD